MASVFLSYDRDDANKARALALALEKAGHEVWWDLHVRGGAQFSKVIEEALRAANAVVVLWSKHSVESAWVRDEAAAGRDSGRLIPVSLDDTEPPLGFRQFQTIDLSGWKGRGKSAQLRTLLADLAALPGSKAPSSVEISTATSAVSRERSALSRPVLAAIGLVLVAALAVLAWKLTDRSSSAPVVAVAAADPSPASQALARDLLVKLGTLQTARPNSIELVSHDATAKKPALIFQVGRSGRAQGAEANLALTDGKDRSLLWAKDFRDPNGNEADLRQQLAFMGAHVLRCALETRDPAARGLSRQGLKTYLNACAPSRDAGFGELVAAISPLQQLVREAPHFAGGWAKLLLAETDVAVDSSESEGAAMRPVLARHITEARKLHPHLAETYLAQFAMTPGARFLERSHILDEGIRRNPDSAGLRYARQFFLHSVGRMEDALRDGRRAMELDPLSPDYRHGYVLSLAFAGRLDEALAQLDEAERLWPGATIVRGARYVVHLRTGDPREALKLLRAGVLQDTTTPWMRIQESLLQARIDRSPQNIEAAIQTATKRYSELPLSVSGLLQTLAEFDRKDELFRILLNWRRMDLVTEVVDVLFRPNFSDLHADPRFMQVAKHLGLLDYWRATGKWPDFCSRVDLPYDCKKEAAKLTA